MTLSGNSQDSHSTPSLEPGETVGEKRLKNDCYQMKIL